MKSKCAVMLIGCNISSVVLHCQLKQWNCAINKIGSNISSVVLHTQVCEANNYLSLGMLCVYIGVS
ncbi:MAG: hypothetical protein GY696_40245 [Gammaproteobacteria bacterium]|nr:hypothetical protein [Gammaproteobacteria bacterium]